MAAPEEKRSDDMKRFSTTELKIYNEPLKEIQDFYIKKGLLKVIDAERELEPIVMRWKLL